MADPFFEPVSGFELPRFAGVPTFMRLPHVPPGHERFGAVEIGLVGVPWDGGTTNRAGARHGPRNVRDASTMIRACHPLTRLSPFRLVRCADLGDVGPNPIDVEDTLARITGFYGELVAAGITPLTIGGDHLTSLPVLRALARNGPLGMIHFDAHTDLYQGYFGGYRFTHGTPFRRAVEEGLLDPRRVTQIGIRGTAYDFEDVAFGESSGVRMIRMEELCARGGEAVMEEARARAGTGPVYVSFDIDFLDPAYAPGTGTPEIGGPTSLEAQTLVRQLSGLQLVGADLVEVSPPFDPTGVTAWVGASMLFEILCPLAEAVAARRS